MRRIHPEAVPVPLEVTTLPGDNDLDGLECTACREVLVLHQPDPKRPLDLLGTCGRCGGWYYIAMEPEEDEVVLARLIVTDLMRAAQGPT